MSVKSTKHEEKIIKKTDEVLDDYGYSPLSGDHEKALAVATSLKLSRGSYSSLINSIVVAIPFFVGWIAGGGGFTRTYWGLFGAALSVSLAFTFFRDKGSREAAAAVLEKRIISDSEKGGYSLGETSRP